MIPIESSLSACHCAITKSTDLIIFDSARLELSPEGEQRRLSEISEIRRKIPLSQWLFSLVPPLFFAYYFSVLKSAIMN
jgi:hypothetical protein